MNEKIKFFKRIDTKLFLLTFASIVITVAITATTQYLGVKEMVHETLWNHSNSALNAIKSKVDEMRKNSSNIAQIMSENDELLYAFTTNDIPAIRSSIDNILLAEHRDVDYVIVTDGKSVLYSTNNNVPSNYITSSQIITASMNGNIASILEKNTLAPLLVASSVPIKNDNGNIIGSVAVYNRLDNAIYLDELKSLIGADFSIFSDGKLISTTLPSNSSGEPGTILTSDLTSSVINNREIYTVRTTILDLPYYTAYEPILYDGEVLGVYFAGINISGIKIIESNLVTRMIFIVFSVIGAILLINLAIARKMIVRPILALSSAAHELASGNLTINSLSAPFKDEIGLLTNSVLNVSNVLCDLISEMETISHKHNAGEIDSLIIPERYHGAYKDMVEGINKMVESYIQHLYDIWQVLRSFGEGDFGAEYALLPGKKQQSNVVVEELRNKLRSISSEIDMLAIAAYNGNLSVRANADIFSGDWGKLLTALNQVMEAIIKPISEASDVLEKMAEGRLDTEIQGTYKGDFEIIKHSVNKTQKVISSYIAEISTTLSAISSHDLTVDIDRIYIGDFKVIRDSINEIVQSFNKALKEINISAEQVSTGAQNISDSSSTLASTTANQSDAVNNLDKLIEKVASQADGNAQKSQKVNVITKDVQKHIEEEATMMKEMLISMDGINEASNNIAQVIKAIDDIAFQTNLLALNASVEAARAGEHGKGFAVVADEVRTLALRSKEAAANTASLIDTSRERVNEGVGKATKTAEGLDSVVGMILEVTRHIEGIANASSDQSNNIAQISEHLFGVSQVTESNMAISEENASYAEELSSQALLLSNTAAMFKLK